MQFREFNFKTATLYRVNHVYKCSCRVFQIYFLFNFLTDFYDHGFFGVSSHVCSN